MIKFLLINVTIFFWFYLELKSDEIETPWVENEYVKTRLISSKYGLSMDTQDPLYIAWEIELKKEGWKTYWRSPGDAGKPTIFNWEGSLNLGEVKVYYPIPKRFEIFDIQTFGYENNLVLPIQIKPLVPGAPITLNVESNFMACKEICIPFEAEYVLDIPIFNESEGDRQTEFSEIIYSQMSKIPGEIGGLMAGSLKIKNINLSGPPGYQRLVITITSDKLLTGADILIETEGGFHFDVPQKKLFGEGQEVQFVIPIVSTSENIDLMGQKLTLTILDGWGGAAEKKIVLD